MPGLRNRFPGNCWKGVSGEVSREGGHGVGGTVSVWSLGTQGSGWSMTCFMSIHSWLGLRIHNSSLLSCLHGRLIDTAEVCTCKFSFQTHFIMKLHVRTLQLVSYYTKQNLNSVRTVNARNWWKPAQKRSEHAAHTEKALDSNQGPSCCEATPWSTKSRLQKRLFSKKKKESRNCYILQ